MEKLIDVREIELNNIVKLISLVKIDNIYVVEKCILENKKIDLIHKSTYKLFEDAINEFNKD